MSNIVYRWAKERFLATSGPARDHLPSKCCIAYGEYLNAWLMHDLVGAAEPPAFQCPCGCRRCQRGPCPTVVECNLGGLLAEQRERTAGAVEER